MAINITLTDIQFKRDTEANYASANPVLLAGEPAYSTDNPGLKIGDGVTAWSSLPYLSSGGGSSTWGSITGTLSSQTDLQSALDDKANSSHTHTLSDITDLGSLSITESQISDLQSYLLSSNIDTLAELNSIVSDATLITDAPSDGSNYGRNNGAWVVIAAGGETDPIFTASEAANITAQMITDLGNLSGTNTGDQNAAGVSIADVGTYFTGTDVEAALQEVGAAASSYPTLSGNNTFTGSNTFNASVAFATTQEMAFGDVSALGSGLGIFNVASQNFLDVHLGTLIIRTDTESTAWTFAQNGNLTGTATSIITAGNVIVNDEVYGAGWNGSNEVPTKNAVYDEIESIVLAGGGNTIFNNSYYEDPSGTKDGVNTTFTVAEGEYNAGSLVVYLNGQALWVGNGILETTPGSGIFDFETAPVALDDIYATYDVGTVNASQAIVSDITGLTGATEINNIVAITQAGYDAIGAPDANTQYSITDAPEYRYVTTYLSDGSTDLTTGTNLMLVDCPYTGTITNVYATLGTAPTGASIIVDVNLNGSTIMTTNKIEIEATETSSRTAATQPGLTTTAIAAGDILAYDIDQIGATVAGSGFLHVVVEININ